VILESAIVSLSIIDMLRLLMVAEKLGIS